MKRLVNEEGLTLPEVLIACAIVVSVIVATIMLFPYMKTGNMSANYRAIAFRACETVIEDDYRHKTYSEIEVEESDPAETSGIPVILDLGSDGVIGIGPGPDKIVGTADDCNDDLELDMHVSVTSFSCGKRIAVSGRWLETPTKLAGPDGVINTADDVINWGTAEVVFLRYDTSFVRET